MGRPDTLGADSYHNRRFSHVAGDGRTETAISLDPPFCSIIKPMVDFSKIIRKVCLGIYLKDHTSDIVSLAYQIERELDEWVDGLPHSIRPRTKPNNQPETLRGSKEPRWSKRQKLVLLIREVQNSDTSAFDVEILIRHWQDTTTSESCFSALYYSLPRMPSV